MKRYSMAPSGNISDVPWSIMPVAFTYSLAVTYNHAVRLVLATA